MWGHPQLYRAAMPSTIPDVPGTLVTDEIQLGFLRDHVRDLCQISSVRYVNTCLTPLRFPGSQPISFNKKSVSYLLKEEYVFYDLHLVTGYVRNPMGNGS